ncbi:MAG: hypothetical protein J1F09_04060 [Oscillospiraceae bacterium]|nr:hypothetical protein [Oscillospiraceae bacterium]
MSGYDDIINLPHRDPQLRPRMSQHDRAAQFAAFAALTGFDGVIEETARLTDERLELSDDRALQINKALQILIERIREKPFAKITFFVPDERKSGGGYRTLSGNVRRIDEAARRVIFTDGREVPIGDICDIRADFP